MNIAFLSQEVPGVNEQGGIGFHFAVLAKALVKRGHRVTVFFDGSAKFEQDGVTFSGIWWDTKLWRAAERATRQHEVLRTLVWSAVARRAIRLSGPYTLIEIPEYHSTPLLLLTRFPVVMSIHGGKRQTSQLNDQYSPFIYRLLHILEFYTVRHTKYRYAVSPLQAKKAEEIYGCPVPLSFANPIDTEFFSASRGKKSPLGEKKYFLFTGRMERRKGIQLLIDAYVKLAREKQPHLPDLVCIGADFYHLGPEKNLSVLDYLERYVPPRIARHIHYLEHLPQEELRKYYAFAEACIFPSLEEPFGNVVVEAMSCRAPVLVTRTSGVTAWLTDGKDAVFMEPTIESVFTEMKKVLSWKDSKKVALGKAARRTAQRSFSSEHIAEQIEAFYLQLVS